MSRPMYPVIHFELPVGDAARASRFYENVFGWETDALGPEAGGFVLAYTTDTDRETRMPRKLGAINGGFYQRTSPDQRLRITILVDDIREAMERIRAAGGTLVPGAHGAVDEIPGVGLFATFRDPEGNVVTVYEDRTPNPTPEQRALLSTEAVAR